MHHRAIARQANTGDNFIFPIQGQCLFLFIEKRINEIEQIAREKLRRIARQAARHIIMRHQLHALMLGHFTGFGQFAITALLDRQIDQHRAGLHAFEHFLGDQFRRRTARNKRRADNNILLGNMLGHQCLLALLIISAHLFGITALGLAAIIFIGFDHHKCAAKAFHLFGSGAAHIRGTHNRAQTFGRGNGLQTGNARAHHENTRRRNRARRRHHHWQGAGIFRGCVQHGFIAGQIGLRGQNIH